MLTEEFDFYHRLSPKLQNDLIVQLFGNQGNPHNKNNFLYKFKEFFCELDQQFINNLVATLTFQRFRHGVKIQSAQYDAEEVYFVNKGGIAVSEATCYSEPLLIYGEGSVINLYQILMNETLQFDYLTISSCSFDIKKMGTRDDGSDI